MSDSFTEVTSTSWLSRIKSSIGGVFFGIILIIAGIILLQWNEGRTIKTKRALNEGAEKVVSISATVIDPANENKLVHLSGIAITESILKDNVFGVSENAIHLKRDVEMYQWKETESSKKEKKLGGSKETTTVYNYAKAWSSSLNNSSNFKISEGHTNPSGFLYNKVSKHSSDVTVGDFQLSGSQIGSIGGYESVDLSNLAPLKIENASITDNVIFIGKGSTQAPQIGDMKVRFSIVKSKTISLVSVQKANTFMPYVAENGKNIELLSIGTQSAKQMFKSAQNDNKLMGYLLRVLGIVMIFIGFSLIFKPLSVLADVVPFIGSIVGFGTGILAFLLSLIIGLVTIAVAWIAYRPLVAIPLLVIALGLAVYIFVRKKKTPKVKTPEVKAD